MTPSDMITSFELKVLAPPAGGVLKYRDLLILLLRSPKPNKGIVKKELKLRMSLIRLVELAEQAVPFSPRALAFVQELADVYPWGAATAELEQFLDDLEACAAVPDTEPVTPEKEI